jgi:FkbM family methyltransferase
MEDRTIYNISENFKLFCDKSAIKEGYAISLEEYRCKEFFTKEPETINWIKSFKKNEVFYDIGANIGQYSIYASVINPSLKVYAFEPQRINYNRMCDNIILNEVKHVVPLLVGISDNNLIEKFFIKDNRVSASGNQLGQSVDEYGKQFCPSDIEYVLASSLDDFVKQFNLPLPNHIKIDVDGIEGKIVMGMEKTIKERALKSVLIEVNRENGGEAQLNSINSVFEEFGFFQGNQYNQFSDHSRHRRKRAMYNIAENVIFTRR